MMMTSTSTTTTSSSVDVTIFEADNMCTKEEMYHMITDVIQQLYMVDHTFSSVLDLWGWIVRSKQQQQQQGQTSEDLVAVVVAGATVVATTTTTSSTSITANHNNNSNNNTAEGRYSLSAPLQIPMYFPHALATNIDLGSLPFHHFPLCEKDMLHTKTPDASKMAWYAGKMTLTISPDVWELKQDLAELSDPPVPCHVKIRMSNLQFKSFADVNELCEYQAESNRHIINVFRGDVRSHEDLRSLAQSMDNIARFSHCRSTDSSSSSNNNKLADRLWYDLIQSRKGKNMFFMQMPFLVRMVTLGYDVSQTPTDSIMRLEKNVEEEGSFATFYKIPADHNTDSRIGLFSSCLNMIVSNDRSRIPLLHEELWPDISPSLSGMMMSSPPPLLSSSSSSSNGINVWVYFSNVKYVSCTTEQEIYSMYSSSSCSCCSSSSSHDRPKKSNNNNNNKTTLQLLPLLLGSKISDWLLTLLFSITSSSRNINNKKAH